MFTVTRMIFFFGFIALFVFFLNCQNDHNGQTPDSTFGLWVDSNYNFIDIDTFNIVLSGKQINYTLSGAVEGDTFTGVSNDRYCKILEVACPIELSFKIKEEGALLLSSQDAELYSFFEKKGPITFYKPEDIEYFRSWDSLRIEYMVGLDFDILQEELIIHPNGKLKIRSGLIKGSKGKILGTNIDNEKMKVLDHFIKSINPNTFSIFHGYISDAETKIFITLFAENGEYAFAGYFLPPYFEPFWRFISKEYRQLDYH